MLYPTCLFWSIGKNFTHSGEKFFKSMCKSVKVTDYLRYPCFFSSVATISHSFHQSCPKALIRGSFRNL